MNNKISDKELYIKAQESLKNSYAPYSKFRVGAAVLTKSGEVFTGVNIENSAYGATICAERTALSKAISEGYIEIDSIAVTSDEGWAYPCGTCRQFIFEFGEDIRIIVGENENNLRVHKASELLPHGFRLNNGNLNK